LKRWIGRWIIATSILHTAFALFVFWNIWVQIAADGIFDTVKEIPEVGAPVFFLFWGLLYFIFGLVIDALEIKQIVLPISLGWGLLIHAIVAVVLIPQSGFWLLFPPSIFVIVSNR